MADIFGGFSCIRYAGYLELRGGTSICTRYLKSRWAPRIERGTSDCAGIIQLSSSNSSTASGDESMVHEVDGIMSRIFKEANMFHIYLASKTMKIEELMEEDNEKCVSTPKEEIKEAVAAASLSNHVAEQLSTS
ncbi:hypothetical protein WN944_003973 [Citrus x changshan-huyou]|uniref:Uncharacterized protein n=1 Tax=Citrus x changshan-huyou TaxID=2935761 RepID=A0AAP0QLQ3_9ROSI